MIEFPRFYEHMSGKDNLKLHCEYIGYYMPESVENTLEMLGLSEETKKPVKSYSLGMKQRLGIARAILCRPELLVLDEPTNGLDQAGMNQLRDLFRMLCCEYGITIMACGVQAGNLRLHSHGAKSMRSSFVMDFDMGSMSFYIQLLMKSVVTISMGFIALFVKPSKTSIVTSFILIFLTQANIGDFFAGR